MLSLCLHSTGTGPSLWDGAPVIGNKVAPANIGYPPNPPLRRGQHCRALDDAKAAAKVVSGPVHIYAHSYGGVVALEMLSLVEVASLFLFEPVIFAAVPDEMAIFPDWFINDEGRGGSDEWLGGFIDYWNRPGSWERLPEPAKAFTRSVGWKMFQEVHSCSKDITSFTARPLPRVPVTLVTTERSPKAARKMVEGLAEAYPWAVVETLEGTGHMAPLTHPGKMHAAMRSHNVRAG